jgi:hypothetical protein
MIKAVLKPFDYILVLLSVIAVVFLSVFIYSAKPEEVVLRIDSAGGEYLYPLDENLEIEIEGPIGHTHVVVEDGRAYISYSPCEDQLCVLMGPVSEAGQWAACMPNRVFISIEGGKPDEEIDILSY